MHFPDLSFPFTDPVLVFATVMLIVLIAPLLFRLIKIPGMVGHIVAGIIVGPHAIGMLQRGATMELLGTVGLLYLMFTAGLEIDLNGFKKNKSKSIVFGFASFLLPQITGMFLFLLVMDFSWQSSILIGSVFASHTLLAYPIISRFGASKNSAVTLTVGGTILTDVFALLVLAIISGSAEGNLDTAFWLRLILSLSAFVGVVIFTVPRIGKWFFKYQSEEDISQFIFVMAVVFTSSFLATLAGVEAIIGAFLAGLTLNRLIPEKSVLMNRVQFVGNALFIPFFLIATGMLVDLNILFEGMAAWTVAGLMLGTVLLTKFSAAQLASSIYKYDKNEKMVIFGLSVPQAAATLAAALIGYELEIFNEFVLNGTILMILATSIIGPWFVERYGRKVAAKEEKEYNPDDAPQRILVPLANPETADTLMDIAMMIRHPGSDEPLYPLTVTSDGRDVGAQVARSEKMLSHAVVHATAADLPVEPVTRIDNSISTGIVRAVKELRISEIVIGWNGTVSAKSRIFGSILDRLLDNTDEMVIVASINRPISLTDRVVLAVPPHAELEPGFYAALDSIKTFISQIGAIAVILATDQNMEAIKENIEKGSTDLDAKYINLTEWDQLLSSEHIQLKEKDLLVLLNAREGYVSWQPSLERLPRKISTYFPDSNFLVVYPFESRERIPTSKKTIPLSYTGSIPAIDEDHIVLDQDIKEYQEALRVILEKKFGDKKRKINSLTAKISELKPDNGQRELPGFILHHIKNAEVEKPTLLMGVFPNGITHQSTTNEIRCVVILLLPKNITFRQTMNSITELTARLKEISIHQDLSQIKNIQAFKNIFGQLKE
ncbi:MAG: cation:proton antiporter [Balneolaceae bacterium]